MDIFNKILIIDDDPIHNMVSSKLIEKAKFSNKTDKVLSGSDSSNKPTLAAES